MSWSNREERNKKKDRREQFVQQMSKLFGENMNMYVCLSIYLSVSLPVSPDCKNMMEPKLWLAEIIHVMLSAGFVAGKFIENQIKFVAHSMHLLLPLYNLLCYYLILLFVNYLFNTEHMEWKDVSKMLIFIL